MFDFNYLKTLFVKNKNLMIFLTLVHFLLNPFAYLIINGKYEYLNHMFMSFSSFIFFVSVYIIVVINYAFIKNKKSTDIFFALPIKRNIMMNTLFLNSAISVTIPYLVNGVISSIIIGVISSDVTLIGKFITSCLLLVFISLLWMSFLVFINNKTNSVIDGIIAIFGWSLLPVFILSAINHYIVSFIPGSNYMPLNYYDVLPIPGILNFIFNDFNGEYNVSLITTIIIIGVISWMLLKNDFKNYKAENAEQISDHWLIYPTLIIVTTISLVTSVDIYHTDMTFFVIVNVIIFIFYEIANFIYQRRISINYKSVFSFILIVILVNAFAFALVKTKTFGLAYHYPKSDYVEFNAELIDENNENSEFYNITIYTNKEKEIELIKEFQSAYNDNYYNNLGLFSEKNYESKTYTDYSINVYINIDYINLKKGGEIVERNYLYHNLDQIGIDKFNEYIQTNKEIGADIKISKNDEVISYDEYLKKFDN